MQVSVTYFQSVKSEHRRNGRSTVLSFSREENRNSSEFQKLTPEQMLEQSKILAEVGTPIDKHVNY